MTTYCLFFDDGKEIHSLADAFSLKSTSHKRCLLISRCSAINRKKNAIDDETSIEFHNRTGAIISKECGNGCNDVLTSAVLKIAYDGTHFRGWTGSTQKTSTQNVSIVNNNTRQKQSRRSRTLQRKGAGFIKNLDRIRTVEQAMKISLAKLYGNIPTDNIMFDSCSRTDAGVHATSLIVQFYGFPLNRDDVFSDTTETTNSTWAQQRPRSRTDTKFLPLPFDSDLSKLVFVLNRMLPPDVRVIAASPSPDVSEAVPIRGNLNSYDDDEVIDSNIRSSTLSQLRLSFHPTLHTKSKTYIYQFSVGPVQDPLRSQYVWHLDGSSNRAVGMNGKKFNLERANEAANVFVEKIQPRDYSSFRSAFRGNERGRVQSSICTLWRCKLIREQNEILPSWEQSHDSKHGTNLKYGGRLSDGAPAQAFPPKCVSSYDPANVGTYTIVINGDRFLYKMVRNIVGAIVATACGYLDISDIRDSLENVRDSDCSLVRRICAPARGLALCNVEFPDSIVFDWQTG